MSFFANLKRQSKLLVMALVPLLGVFYCAINATLDKTGNAQALAALNNEVDVPVKIRALTHELQKERGMGVDLDQEIALMEQAA